ncbi:MAG TPA: hypothetical protein VMU14_09790 [Acidimicrobiales bacterium]|nr:hypothetical protein [Acidimicrobiales bacterium]
MTTVDTIDELVVRASGCVVCGEDLAPDHRSWLCPECLSQPEPGSSPDAA